MIVGSFNMLFICLSVRLSQVLNFKQSTHFTGIYRRKTSNGVYLYKDMSDRVMVLDSVVCLCVLIIWVTAGQMPAVVTADKEGGFFLYVYVCF